MNKCFVYLIVATIHHVLSPINTIIHEVILLQTIAQLFVLHAPSLLLPQGKIRLSIPALDCKNLMLLFNSSQGVVICPLVEQQHLGVGSHVTVTDFERDTTGCVIIELYCQQLVKIISITSLDDQQLEATVSPLAHWAHEPEQSLPLQDCRMIEQLGQKLAQTIVNNPQLKSLYPDILIHNPVWVVSRWIELLPITLKAKEELITRDMLNAQQFIAEIII
jgi:hypothetical protein